MKSKTSSDSGKWIILLITVISTFMSTLDSSIVNVALPTMANSLRVDTGQITWVVSVYQIVITVFILIFGRLGDLKGQSKIFRNGLLIFTIGSFLCGVTHTLPLLLAARAVQAIGAAASMANSQGIITRTFPAEERGRALGLNGTFVALGTMVGPSLGGFIISFTSWEYLFWVNVPIGLFAFLANMKFSGQDNEPSGEKLDLWGGILFALTIITLFTGLEYGQTVGYSNPLILLLFAVSVIACISFYIVEHKLEMPLLDLKIFKNKWFSVSIFCAFLSFVAIACSNIILPFYLQNVLNMSPGTSGLYLTISPIILSLAAPISGYLSDKIGSEILTLIGLVLTGAGLYLIATLNETPAHWMIALYIGLMSLGNGLFQSPNNSLVMSMVPQEKLGVGGSVNALIRNIGITVGIALSTALLYGGMSLKIGHNVTGYIPGQNGAFIFGMRLSYITVATICMVGVLLTALRFFKRIKKTESESRV